MGVGSLVEKLSVKEFASMIDHTLLKPYADYKLLEKYVEDTRRYGFAVLMLPPSLLLKAREIAGNTIRLATVIGFPLGNTFAGAKVLETRLAAQAGASEVDMVMNINYFKSGDYDRVLDDMKHVVLEARKNNIGVVKVIIETGLLSDEEKVKATELVVESGADYVKTSTGFLAGGATIHDVALLYRVAKGRIKVKAAGGIRHALDALAMIDAGASRIGTSTGDKIIEEFIKLKEGK
ncbi:deoxyribose-phosphate aldolase [Staphylothermus marinus F1]|uniref:Deoxyribose-phosphate aldolase n=1 Tax=Staphylothermus marinus (strain ATCC 43588 / DSM 3639 / JCM 9404 / F1) TaxID=399550 RepID=A3DLD3_STAMF|nr:deoxyribose-phosphate aldolase [Staphylothermus marinus]ABN69443.1 deoxyribose-phosphate aldolase [Staphylothermus marinus F1]